MEGAPQLVLVVMVVVIALSGYSALYFATRGSSQADRARAGGPGDRLGGRDVVPGAR